MSCPEDISIRESADQIFKRPSLSISPETLLPQVATFLAIGPQIYVDGLVVTVGKDPVGRISSKHILQNTINSKYTDWLNTTASELMDRITNGEMLTIRRSGCELMVMSTGNSITMALCIDVI